ncbi:hypothetical protein CVT26_009366 [Gymnopilus dilepis]|uniref:Uncharacterized protein n=1 Tax=Gymnopilus dilepis TaxID=231916 RepID=A0A409WZG4_9AGAR|nr:hypothetical protein CVT26_009366 [Gymnopilus dilepis]
MAFDLHAPSSTMGSHPAAYRRLGAARPLAKLEKALKFTAVCLDSCEVLQSFPVQLARLQKRHSPTHTTSHRSPSASPIVPGPRHWAAASSRRWSRPGETSVPLITEAMLSGLPGLRSTRSAGKGRALTRLQNAGHIRPAAGLFDTGDTLAW